MVQETRSLPRAGFGTPGFERKQGEAYGVG